jgi:oligopeptidase A
MHHMLTQVELRSLAGTNVAWDFVELPSQIMENWCWERDALDLFARHWQSGERLPEDLFARMLAARTFQAASAFMRQIGFAALDLGLHRARATIDDPVSWALDVQRRHAAAPLPDAYGMVCGFTHLFGDSVGYAAGYYSYKWAEVLDADAFTAFKAAGSFDANTGRRFRDTILARGNELDPGELYRTFMGREPKLDALLERAGLISPA